MTSICQVSCCLLEAQVELLIEDDVAVWICATCNLDPNTLPAFRKGPNAGLFYVNDKRTVLACEGEFEFCRPEFEVADVYTAKMGDPYMLPCLGCKVPFVFHWDTSGSMFCEGCRDTSPARRSPAPVSAPAAPEPEPEPEPEQTIAMQVVTLDDLMTHVVAARRAQILEHYEERAAIMEYDGGMRRYVAELAALRDTTDLCEEHGLLQ